MDPRDVNRINYNNYYVGQNLDFLIRSKMRSESLSTPLTNTPASYDGQVSSKMALLGKRGYYDPGYIYGFDNQNERRDNYNNNPNRNNSPQNNDINERRNFTDENPKENFYHQQNDFQMQRRQSPLQREQNIYDKPNNSYSKDIDIRNDINSGPKQYDIRSNQNQNNFSEKYSNNNNNYRNNEEFRKEYDEYIKKSNKYQEQNNQLNNRKDDKDDDGVNPGKTREQIQYDTFIENYKRQQYVKQRMTDDEMKYRQGLYKKWKLLYFYLNCL